jgi:hypothetical protein
MRRRATHVDSGDGVAVVLCVLEESVDIVTDDDLSALVGGLSQTEREPTYTLLAVENFLGRDHCDCVWGVVKRLVRCVRCGVWRQKRDTEAEKLM